jgi:hypothetical protein
MIATRQIEDVLSRAEPWFASRVMREATSIAVSLPFLCELIWVWQRLLGLAMAIGLGDGCWAWRWLFGLAMAVWPARAAVEAGLAPQKAGGDLADGVSALEGQ